MFPRQVNTPPAPTWARAASKAWLKLIESSTVATFRPSSAPEATSLLPEAMDCTPYMAPAPIKIPVNPPMVTGFQVLLIVSIIINF